MVLVGAPGTEHADVVIWLIDRDQYSFPRVVNDVREGPQFRGRETYTKGWFEDGMRTFADDVPTQFILDAIEALRRICLGCKKVVESADQLQRAGFTGFYCKDCHADAKKQAEFPGWAN